MSSKRRIAGIALVVGMALGVGVAGGVALDRWLLAGDRDPVTTAGVFQDVMSAIRANFVDSLSDDELAVRAAKGIVNSLGDPYSSVLTRDEFDNYRHILGGTGSSALGLTLVEGVTGVRVSSVLPGSAADRAGLFAGQAVVSVDGVESQGGGFDRVTSQLRRSAGPTAVEVRTPGDSVTTVVELEPGPVRVPAVGSTERLDDRIGYVALGAVSEHAYQQLRSALDSFGRGMVTGVILDLRGNFGGRLDQALEITDLFLPEGLRIGAVTKRQAFPALYMSSSPESHPGLRLVILVDRRTASSAEIIAAALQDHRRATLVGERTLGKGLIQTTVALGDSVALRLSTGRWQRPNGSGIERGLVPDVAVASDRAEARLRSVLAGRRDIVALHLERAAVRVAVAAESPDSAQLTDAELQALDTALREAGVALPADALLDGRGLLDRELRWLAALTQGKRGVAGRLRLLADPVVAKGLGLLAPGADSLPAEPPR